MKPMIVVVYQVTYITLRFKNNIRPKQGMYYVNVKSIYLVDGFLLLPTNNLFNDLTVSLHKPACRKIKMK